VEAGAYLHDVVLEIVDGRIVGIRTDEDGAPLGAIDLGDRTILPGLIDVHTHLADRSWQPEEEFDYWGLPAPAFGIVGAVSARATLHAGFTTVRSASEPYFAGPALRDAIAAGWIEGPRVFAAGPMISITGGHGAWGNWMAPEHRLTTSAHAVADGEDQVRRTVREQIRANVDLIKISATGGYGTARTVPGAASYTEGELRAAVDEGRKRGIPVAVHAHGPEGILNAIRAGAHSIEHASMIDQEGIEAARAAGTWLVMDLLAAHYDLIEVARDYDDKELEGDNRQTYRDVEERFRQAYEAGSRMAFGTDSGVYPHGRNAEQFALMVAAGMSPLDALRSATIHAADLLGIAEDTGHTRPGARADLVAVPGDPLRDPSVLTGIDFVMKAGRVVRQPEGR
jgi:imidazolonepropionase-like amidohydrolase